MTWRASELQNFENDPERIFQAKRQLIANAEREIPAMLGADKKSATALVKFYKAVRGMAFAEKIDVAALI